MFPLDRGCFTCRIYFLRRRGLMKVLTKTAAVASISILCIFMLYSSFKNQNSGVAKWLSSSEVNESVPIIVLPPPKKTRHLPRPLLETTSIQSDVVNTFCQTVHLEAFDGTATKTAAYQNVTSLLKAYNCSGYRQQKIVEMTKSAWDGYVDFAWGENEVRPVTRTPHRMSVFGNNRLGLTIVDSLDTLYLMGLHGRFENGRNWIKNEFNIQNARGSLSVFETTIRFIGGLLSCYALTNDLMFLRKAQEVADVLLPAFNTTTGIPYALIDMERRTGRNWFWAAGGSSILAELGTLHLEFEYLSVLTGNPVYFEKVDRVRRFLHSMHKPDGLYPNYVNPMSGSWGSKHVSINALGDSFYEYLLKSWLITGKRDILAKSMYDAAMQAIVDKLLRQSKSGLTYFVELKGNHLVHKMDHLGCFIGGLFALHSASDAVANNTYRNIAREITRTCHESYIRTATHLGPEAFSFGEDVEAEARGSDRYYMLRPEVIESYFYLWRTTKDPMYREWAWDAAVAIEKYCKAEAGYSGIRDVYSENPDKDDVQQSFFLSETLKYLYLTFSPDEQLSLKTWVFNSEAHPFPIRVSDREYRVL